MRNVQQRPDYSDEIIQSEKPSQWVNFYWYLAALAWFIAMGIDLMFIFIVGVIIYKILDIWCWRYDFRERTVVERRGILSVRRRELHYYRVKAILIEQPIHLRILGLSRIRLRTSDRYPSQKSSYDNELLLYGFEQPETVREWLRSIVDLRRKQEGIKEHDLFLL